MYLYFIGEFVTELPLYITQLQHIHISYSTTLLAHIFIHITIVGYIFPAIATSESIHILMYIHIYMDYIT